MHDLVPAHNLLNTGVSNNHVHHPLAECRDSDKVEETSHKIAKVVLNNVIHSDIHVRTSPEKGNHVEVCTHTDDVTKNIKLEEESSAAPEYRGDTHPTIGDAEGVPKHRKKVSESGIELKISK